MSGPRRILLVFNPAAGGGRSARVGRIVEALGAYGCPVAVVETNAPGHAERIAREASPAEYDVVVAGGGDGTVNEIINGLAGKDIALGVAPLGTANVLADEIGLSRAPDAIARALALGPVREIRLGRAEGRRFVMMAGVGFDAAVVSRVSLRLKKYIGALAYVWESLKLAPVYGFEACDAVIDGVAYRPTSLVACNGRRYGGPFVAAPAASLAAGEFQVILLNGRGWRSVLRYAVALAFGRLAALHDVQVIAGRDVAIGGAQPVQADGDIIAHTPLRLTIDPQPQRLVYPA